MARRGVVATAVFAGVLIGVIAFGWKLYQQSSCINAEIGVSCPDLVDVNGVRYTVSVPMDLVASATALTVYGPVTQTNVPDLSGGSDAYSLADFDPSVLLVARARPPDEGDAGGYRLLFAVDRDQATLWPALCGFIPVERRATPECSAPA